MKSIAPPLLFQVLRQVLRSTGLPTLLMSCSCISLALLLLVAGCSASTARESSQTKLTAAESTASDETPADPQRSPAKAETPQDEKLSDEKLQDETPPVVAPPYAAALVEFHRGAAFMEQYEYARAAAAFMNVAERAPDWTAARFNLALAYINMAGENNPDKRIGTLPEMLHGAVSTLESLLNDDPHNQQTRQYRETWNTRRIDNQ